MVSTYLRELSKGVVTLLAARVRDCFLGFSGRLRDLRALQNKHELHITKRATKYARDEFDIILSKYHKVDQWSKSGLVAISHELVVLFAIKIILGTWVLQYLRVESRRTQLHTTMSKEPCKIVVESTLMVWWKVDKTIISFLGVIHMCIPLHNPLPMFHVPFLFLLHLLFVQPSQKNIEK